MKKIALILIGIFLISSTQSFAQEDKSKRKSPPATVEGTIGDANITINYSSPSVKGREIFGGLLPYNKIWRAGANEATTFETSEDLVVEGKKLPAGKYSFFVIPKSQGKWTAIFNEVAKQWGAYKYDQSKDVLRVKAKVETVDTIENLSYKINDNSIVLEWANKQLTLDIAQ